MHQNASPHNNWTCIWVNHNNSLTWKIRPFRDDSPIKTMITVRSRREVVSKFTQMYLLLILLSLEMRGRTQERTMAVRFLAGKPPKLFSSTTFGRILSCRPVFGEEEVNVIWCDDWPIFPWVEEKNSGFAKTWRHGWLLYSQKLSTQWSAAMWTKIQLLEILKSQMIKYVAGKIYNIEAPKKSPNMISRYLRAKKDPFIKMKQNLKWC